MAFIFKAVAGITALLVLTVTLLGSLLTLGGFLLSAIKILTIVIFATVLVITLFSILRNRSRRRREASDF
jgi:amino acid permease